MEELTPKLVAARNDAMQYLREKGWSDADIARVFKMHESNVGRRLRQTPVPCLLCGSIDGVYAHVPSETWLCWDHLRSEHPEYAEDLVRKYPRLYRDC